MNYKLIIFFCFFYLSCQEKKSISQKEEIMSKISNDVFIPKDFDKKEILFLKKNIIQIMRLELQINYM